MSSWCLMEMETSDIRREMPARLLFSDAKSLGASLSASVSDLTFRERPCIVKTPRIYKWYSRAERNDEG